MRAAYYILHYGREWLKWSMRSIREHVDEIHVFYVSTPSHGTQTPLPCPETMIELKDIADEFGATWWNCPHFAWEGEHRDFAVNVLKQRKADTILVVDADEIWPVDYLRYVLDAAEHCDYNVHLVNMMHFWRSLKWVCHDAAMPVRVLRPNSSNPSECYLSTNNITGNKVFHMGYAQTPEIVYYKQQIHGHKAEWRDGWFENTFLPWVPGVGDVHPTNVDFWTPVEYNDEDGMLKKLCGDHPYWDLDLIISAGKLD